jgi:hypothetical protein
LYVVAIANGIDFGAVGTVAGDWQGSGAPGPLRAGAFGWRLSANLGWLDKYKFWYCVFANMGLAREYSVRAILLHAHYEIAGVYTSALHYIVVALLLEIPAIL